MVNIQSEKSIQPATSRGIPDLIFQEDVNVCVMQEESRIILFLKHETIVGIRKKRLCSVTQALNVTTLLAMLRAFSDVMSLEKSCLMEKTQKET